MALYSRHRRKKHPFFDLPSPALSAHRGAAGIRPENTVLSFQTALDQGADILETDLQITADGIPVLSHDPYVDRITEGSGPISGLTLAELQTLDAGYWFTADGETYPYRGQGHRIISIQEAFDRFPYARFTLDLKVNDERLVQSVVALIGEYNRADITLLASFNQETMDKIREAVKAAGLDIATAATSREVAQCLVTAKLGRMMPPPEVMSLFVPPTAGADQGYRFPAIITERFNRQAHALNIPVFAWTVDSAAIMEPLLKTGIDGLVTNYPGRAAPLILGERQRRAMKLEL